MWTPASLLNDSYIKEPVTLPPAITTKIYTLIATDVYGCSSLPSTVTVTVSGSGNVDCSYSSDVIKEYYYHSFCGAGLGIGDLLSLDYGDMKRELEAGKMPLAIEGYRHKTGVQLRTFIGRDAIHYLRMYLDGQILRKDSPLFTLLGTEKRMTSNAVRKQFRLAAKKLPFIIDEDLEESYNPGRPHSLRSAFRSRLTGKMDGDLIETFMAHDIGQEKSTYMRLPLDELRELYANYEHLLAIEKTSKEEAASEAIPEVAMKMIREQGQKLAELEVKLEEAKASLVERESRLLHVEHTTDIIMRALANPEAAPVLWKALKELEEKAGETR